MLGVHHVVLNAILAQVFHSGFSDMRQMKTYHLFGFSFCKNLFSLAACLNFSVIDGILWNRFFFNEHSPIYALPPHPPSIPFPFPFFGSLFLMFLFVCFVCFFKNILPSSYLDKTQILPSASFFSVVCVFHRKELFSCLGFNSEP